MCLAVPARVVAIRGRKADVELLGHRSTAILSLVPEARLGDWVLVHAGYAITLLDEEQAKQTYDLLQQGEAPLR